MPIRPSGSVTSATPPSSATKSPQSESPSGSKAYSPSPAPIILGSSTSSPITDAAPSSTPSVSSTTLLSGIEYKPTTQQVQQSEPERPKPTLPLRTLSPTVSVTSINGSATFGGRIVEVGKDESFQNQTEFTDASSTARRSHCFYYWGIVAIFSCSKAAISLV